MGTSRLRWKDAGKPSSWWMKQDQEREGWEFILIFNGLNSCRGYVIIKMIGLGIEMTLLVSVKITRSKFYSTTSKMWIM